MTIPISDEVPRLLRTHAEYLDGLQAIARQNKHVEPDADVCIALAEKALGRDISWIENTKCEVTRKKWESAK